MRPRDVDEEQAVVGRQPQHVGVLLRAEERDVDAERRPGAFDAIGSEKSEAPDARLSERNCARAA